MVKFQPCYDFWSHTFRDIRVTAAKDPGKIFQGKLAVSFLESSIVATVNYIIIKFSIEF